MELNNQEMATQIATNLIEDSVRGAWKKVKDFFADASAKDAIDYGDAYEEYLRNTRNKYSKIKTLIYRRVPKELYSFYECIGVNYNGETVDSSQVENLLEKERKIIITGTGGIGKSTLFKHLYLNTIEETGYIPVLIELRNLNSCDIKDISIKNAIFENLTRNGFALSEHYFDYSMKMGGYVIFFDGFDEINRDRISIVSDGIRSVCDQYGENHYLVSSRPSDSFIGWNDFAEMTAQKLTKQQALSLINKIEFDPKTKSNFSKELESHLYDKYESFASNPLLLTIMLLTYSDHAVFPEKLNDFYEQAFSTLFNMHDATKESYVRDIRSDLGCEDFKTIFSYICFKSYFAGEYQFTETGLREHIQKAKEKFGNIRFSVDDYQEDLTLSVCMLVKEGLVFRFAHRSFQEYFAALYTCKLPDEIQEKLLTNWMKESHTTRTDSYFDMLFNMQGEKVNKVVFAPGIKKLRRLYNEQGYSIGLFKTLFDGVIPRKKVQDEKENTLALRIKDDYLCSILMLVTKLNGYVYPSDQQENENEIISQLLGEDHKNNGKLISFDDAVKIVGEKPLLDVMVWFETEVKFAIDLLNKTEKLSIGNKKKVSSILEAL